VRRRRRQAARRRLAALVAGLTLLLVVIVVAIASSGGSGNSGQTSGTAHRHARPRLPAPAVESGLLPWQLATPISREVVLPGAGNKLIALGGLQGSTSESGVYSLTTTDGSARQLGRLPAGVHDAAGAVVRGRDIVFGGGSPATVATVETFSSGSGSAGGRLPAPRSDAGAATIGRTAYIVGGYDGTKPDATVLATSDGHSYQSVATLAVPVRYPAVASAGGKLYVFGGEVISGAHAGHPTDDIQMVDPSGHSASVVGHLPEPLEAAAAVVLGGHIYLAGGDSSSPQTTVTGVGSTQLSPPVSAAGGGGLTTVSTIWTFDPATKRLLVAGRLQVPASHAGVAVLGSRAWLVGGESGDTQLAAVQMFTPDVAFGRAGEAGAGSPYFGDKLLVADRANNHLLLMNPAMRIEWKFPSANSPHDPLGFFFPDDAFFVKHGTAILTNQEENETLQLIGFPSGKVLWSYGHPKQPGTAQGYLHEPDDAYLLKNGQITVADADNCRVLVINPNHTVAHQIGTDGACIHNPPTSMGSPNGDTPLADGNLLVSEINGSWVTEYTPTGHEVWTVQLPISYPSDPQQIGSDLYLIADYATPGEILEFNRAGKILYRYAPTSGPGMLNHPSLVERLPSGVFLVNDDYRDRMVAIDPATGALVWQYGTNDHAGKGPGQLNTPDGFDLLSPDGSTPTHPATG
jgi:outer membrane protein assembly factor BamB